MTEHLIHGPSETVTVVPLHLELDGPPEIRVRDLERLHRLADRLLVRVGPEAILAEVLDAAAALSAAAGTVVALREPGRSELTVGASGGRIAGVLPAGALLSGTDSACGRAMAAREPVAIDDVARGAGPEPERALAREANLRAVYCVPLIGPADEPLGAVAVFLARARRPAQRERTLLRLYARQAAFAIHGARLYGASRENEQRYRLLWDTSPIPKWVFDAASLRFLAVNDAAVRHYGFTREEFLDMSLRDVWASDDVPASHDLAAQRPEGEHAAARDETLEWGPVCHRRKDGSVIDAEVAARPIRFHGRRAYLASTRDVTERRAAERQRALLLERERAARAEAEQAVRRTHQLLEVTAAVADALTPDEVADRIVTRAADALGAVAAIVALTLPGEREARILAWRGMPEELVRPWRRFPASAPLPLAESMRTGEPVWIDSPDELARRFAIDARQLGHCRSGVVFPLHANGGITGVLGLGYAAERTQTEEDRVVLQAVATQCAIALERARLYEAERHAVAEARATSEAKSRFLAVMSHELRTPIHAILGFTELLSDGIAGPVNETQRDHLRRARASAQHLLLLIEDILTLSRAEAGHEPVHAETTLVSDVVREAVEFVEPAARAKALALSVELPREECTVLTDRTKLRQILLNLLSNAVKFTDAGRIEVSVRQTRTTLVAQVRDTGVGIAPEHLERIFEPFWQVDQGRARRAGGTGLGLNVSVRLARLLGGDLLVQSTPGTGSVFRLVIPCQAQRAREERVSA